jgi:lysophospholipase L1-like esterase
MKKHAIYLIILSSILFSQTDSVFVHLPDSVYTTSASRFSIYYTNLIRGRFLKNEQIVLNCDVGYPDSMKYNLDSIPAGIYDFNIQIYDSLGSFIEEASTKIVSTDSSISFGDTLKVLFIGDSYSYTGVYPKFVKDTYVGATGKPIKLLGTNYNISNPNNGINNGIFHEGYSGKTWFWHANDALSPFVFDTGINFERYFNEKLGGELPDLVTIQLSINDIGTADPTSIATIDIKIDQIFNNLRMMKVINSLTAALPNTKIGIFLTIPVNERESTYTVPTLPDYWERKVMHHRLCQRFIDHFKVLNNPNISVVPVNVNIDTYLGFGESDSIHPNVYGYSQMGSTLYGWIKYRIALMMTKPENINIASGDGYIELTWDVSPGVSFYRIYRSNDPYSEFVELGTSVLPVFIDDDISGSDKYFYKVTSENSLK